MPYVYIVSAQKDFNLDESVDKLAKSTNLILNFKVSGKFNDTKGAIYEIEGNNAQKIIKECVMSGLYDFDILYLDKVPSLSLPGVLVLDMDMTSVLIEGIDEIARRVGVFDKVAAITNAAMHGGMDFAESLTKRVSMLKGGDANVIDDVKTIMKQMPGLDSLLDITLGHFSRGICSGGFVQLICVLEEKYKLEMVKANSLEIIDGKFTGRLNSAIVDAEAKRLGVLDLMARNQVKKDQVIVLGDGANDLKMIAEAGVGIAYHAKPLVREKAPCTLDHCDLGAVTLLLKLGSKI